MAKAGIIRAGIDNQHDQQQFYATTNSPAAYSRSLAYNPRNSSLQQFPDNNPSPGQQFISEYKPPNSSLQQFPDNNPSPGQQFISAYNPPNSALQQFPDNNPSPGQFSAYNQSTNESNQSHFSASSPGASTSKNHSASSPARPANLQTYVTPRRSPRKHQGSDSTITTNSLDASISHLYFI